MKKSKYETLRDMDYDDLWYYISCKDQNLKNGQPATPAQAVVMTAKEVIAHCPERTLDVCAIMRNKDIPDTETLYFKAVAQEYLCDSQEVS